MGSPFRRLTDEERAIFQKVIDGFYERFLSVIKEGRPRLSVEDIRKLADGRIYSGDQAKTLGLVDGVGYLEDAVTLAKQQAGLTQARLVRYRRAGDYRPNIYALSSAAAGGWSSWAGFDLMSLVRAGTPQFMYLWMP
jgi:protease-4